MNYDKEIKIFVKQIQIIISNNSKKLAVVQKQSFPLIFLLLFLDQFGLVLEAYGIMP